MVYDTVFLYKVAHVHILRTTRQLQSACAIALPVDVSAAAYRVQASVELHVVGLVLLQTGQPLAVAEYNRAAPLTAAQVQRLAVKPPFHAHLLGKFFQGFVAVFTFVVDHHVIGAFHAAHLEVRRLVHAVVDALHYQTHMIHRTGGQREHGLVLAVRVVQHQETLDKALNTVQLQTVLPFYAALFRRLVFLHGPVTLTAEVHVVVHIDGHMRIQREAQAQHIVCLNLLVLRTAVVGLQFRFLIAVLVV